MRISTAAGVLLVTVEEGILSGESMGNGAVGDSSRGKYIDYCTVGYTLQLFLNAPEARED